MNIAKAIEEVEAFEFEWNGQVVHFSAKKASLTPGFVKQIGSVVSFPQAIAQTVTKWDVFWDEAETQAVALVEEELEKLPVNFLDALLGKIMESWNGDKKKSTDSPNGSAVAAA